MRRLSSASSSGSLPPAPKDLRVRNAVRLDVRPPNALVLLRGRSDALKFLGVASQFARTPPEFGERGVLLLVLRRNGWRDHAIRITIAPDGQESISVSLRPATSNPP